MQTLAIELSGEDNVLTLQDIRASADHKKCIR